MKIQEQTISKFLDDLSSSSPTPGGGAVAALSGAMAASLVEMVCNLTIGKKGYENVESSMQKVGRETQVLRKKLVKLADEDVTAYNLVMTAYKLPKENKNRKEEIEKTLIYAMEVPRRVAGFAKEVETLAKKVVRIGNKNAISDAKTAGHLAKAAYSSAMENVRINKVSLASLK